MIKYQCPKIYSGRKCECLFIFVISAGERFFFIFQWRDGDWTSNVATKAKTRWRLDLQHGVMLIQDKGWYEKTADKVYGRPTILR